MAHGLSMDLSLPAVRETPPEPVPADVAAENARLRRENHQLREANELLKAVSGFSPHNSTHNVKK